MSPIWELPTPPADASVPSRAVAALLDVALSPSSADALRAVQTVVPVDYRALVRLQRDRPELLEGSASLPQERAVCARIALGLSADGIAADLDVAPSTVITLRKRAYLKLAEVGLLSQRLGLARLLNCRPLQAGRMRRMSLTVPLEGDIGAFTRA